MERPEDWREGEGKTRLRSKGRSEGEEAREREPGEGIIAQNWAWSLEGDLEQVSVWNFIPGK